MKLERRKFIYQGYYNSTMGYPVPCECVLEYIEPIEAEALENRVEKLEKALRKIVDKEYALCYYSEQCDCVKCIAQKALEGK